MDFSGFSSIIELFAVFNLTYLSFGAVDKIVRSGLFSISNKMLFDREANYKKYLNIAFLVEADIDAPVNQEDFKKSILYDKDRINRLKSVRHSFEKGFPVNLRPIFLMCGFYSLLLLFVLGVCQTGEINYSTSCRFLIPFCLIYPLGVTVVLINMIKTNANLYVSKTIAVVSFVFLIVLGLLFAIKCDHIIADESVKSVGKILMICIPFFSFTIFFFSFFLFRAIMRVRLAIIDRSSLKKSRAFINAYFKLV